MGNLSNLNKDLEVLLGSELFKLLFNCDGIKFCHLNIIINLLVKANIPFSLTFSQGTRTSSKALYLKINITPNVTLSFSISI
ncbi:hypothetical protein SAMN05661008_00853 [Alkalithermobacter thermoalcaliphilus JW-YL-7 = DSM 7308]|uniref:Uncharacterized protein n=1 Tax=Alkalithermobacter thermoalcaliphilus JW-YL-7 = DSM 7308 TaxID=1121328 RepID=A0A150FRT6_CLOPD|nr:hypothetical protein JWYL7_1000 [[Clostridium] paradoxum JW-YL-7 = DSM 7308]SHK77093.1 hypothetical protein SAMN05661008_00853 [[Clostridium] paradoxum JW-YL-7 = DSM 7308]